MSALCQKQTFCAAAKAGAIHHFVGEREQRGRDRQSKRLGGSRIDDQLESGRPLDGKIGSLRALENPIRINCQIAEQTGPIGLGSGICGLIRTRDALGLKTKIVGVVSEGANAYLRSFGAGKVVTTNSALTFADGMAVRVPDAIALEIIRKGAERIIEVTDDEVAEAIRSIYSATHNCAEGAGAAALAALMKEHAQLKGRRVAVILTGQNIDRAWMQVVLAGGTPRVSEAGDSRP